MRPGRWGRLLVVLVAMVGLAGCVPKPGTTQGQDMFGLWQVFLWAGLGVGGLVWILATWALLRYRRSPDVLPTQVRGNLPLEAAWTAAPLIVVLALFGLTLQSLSTVNATDPAPDVVRLDVTAFRWGWTFSFPAAGVSLTSQTGTALQVDLPVGTTVQVSLASKDVVHAFYVPDFLFKRDAIPGRISTFDLRVVAPGTYGGECAEYCGVFHDAMPFTIVGVSPAAFQAWLTSQRSSSSAP